MHSSSSLWMKWLQEGQVLTSLYWTRNCLLRHSRFNCPRRMPTSSAESCWWKFEKFWLGSILSISVSMGCTLRGKSTCRRKFFKWARIPSSFMLLINGVFKRKLTVAFAKQRFSPQEFLKGYRKTWFSIFNWELRLLGEFIALYIPPTMLVLFLFMFFFRTVL